MPEIRQPTLHLAARETFAVDGVPACGTKRGFWNETNDGFAATHTMADVTCNGCRRSVEYRRASALGLTENDKTWEMPPEAPKKNGRKPKFSAEDVAHIKDMYRRSSVPVIARLYRVSEPTIHRVLNGKYQTFREEIVK